MFKWLKDFFKLEEMEIVKMEKKKAIIEIYRDKKSEWRWRLKAMNGKIIANAGEGYKNKKDCTTMIDCIVKGIRVTERKISD